MTDTKSNHSTPTLKPTLDEPPSKSLLSKTMSHTSVGSMLTNEKKSALLERLSGTHMVDDKKRILLHGYLRIQIIRAENLRNFDCLGSWACTNAKCCSMIAADVSDPYVTVLAGSQRLLKTKSLPNRLNPEWKQEFFVPVANYTHSLEFRVKDLDLNMTVDRMGTAFLAVEDIVKLDQYDRPMRTGVHRIVNLDDKPRHGTFEYAVEFLPARFMINQMTVPGTYFDPHLNSTHAQFYINSDCPTPMKKADVKELSKMENVDLYKPRRCWRDIYDSFCAAEHVIYVAGWSVDHKQSLLRGEEMEDALKEGRYSPYIGELLKAKADEGVTVNILVWNDLTSNIINRTGVMGTFDEDLRRFCTDTRINLCLAQIVGGHYNPFLGMRNAITCTHHQKMVVCDYKGSLVGYVGGIDLTNGRYETHEYPLFRSLVSRHAGDFYNGCASIVDQSQTGPRQPWHDIHSRLEHGGGVVDLVRNFEERWRCQASDQLDKLVDLTKFIDASMSRGNLPWSCQLFRSIDARTAKLTPTREWSTIFEETQGVTFVEQDSERRTKKREKILLKDSRPIYEKCFVSETAEGIDFESKLLLNRGIETDISAQRALVHHIRRAEHTIYIENQYFLSSSHFWRKHNSVKCGNLVAAEIALKICQKIEANERFAAYILLPMWSEGIPESSAVQEILYWQHMTMEGVYTTIASAIARKKSKDKSFAATPRDYLNFYCLGNRETEEGSEAVALTRNSTIEALLSKTRRHLVYVHSKMTIVDDAVALIGSANMNQRSLDGNRDSELIMSYWQEEHQADKTNIAHGDVHAFRLECWAHMTSAVDEVFNDPSSLACVQRMNEIADLNWKQYTQEAPCEMISFLLPYPIIVTDEGRVKAKTADGHFPDTKAKILGSKSILPDFLTT